MINEGRGNLCPQNSQLAKGGTVTVNDKIYPFLPGENLYLREVRPNDVNDNYYRWLNDREVTRFLESRFYPNSREKLREYVEEKLSDPNNLFLAIVLKEDHRHIGNIKLGPINWMHRFADIGILIGERDCWGRGHATEALRLLADYAFSELNLNKLTAGCYEANAGSLKAFQKAGFLKEGTLHRQFYCEGRYMDGILLGLVKPENT